MTSARWELVTKIFETALEKPLSGRMEFVHSACENDSELESEVKKLLAADEAVGSFLERPILSTVSGLSRSDPPPLLIPGRVVSDRFEIRRFIGQGGMGQVYEAFDLELKQRIALKAIRPDISPNPRAISRFRREVLLTRRVTHPNVCRTFDIDRHKREENGIESEITFLTMELLEGETLADLLSGKGRLTTAEALPLVLQMIEALRAAHSVGIVHRDFKPSNVLLVPSNNTLRVVVTDFGLARAILQDGRLSAEGVANSLTGDDPFLGTLVYMAPEQMDRGEATVASDVYALGLVMYEMVTGKRPFADQIPFAEAVKRIKQPAPSASLHVPNLDARWEITIRRCLEMEPEERFESVQDVANALTAAGTATYSPKGARSMPVRTPRAQMRRRVGPQRWLLIAGPICLLLVSLFAIVIRHYRRGETQFAERDWIIVTDFTNHTGERIFDRVLRDLTVQSLSQSNYLNIVPRVAVLEAAKRTGLKEVNTIDGRLGRELCLREHYKVLLTGDISRDGASYAIAMTVEMPGNDASVMSDIERIQSPGDVYAAIDRLSIRLRRALGESLNRAGTTEKALAQVTTPSLEALQRYSIAVDLYGSREYTRCIALAGDAVDRDPNFAMAHLLLARAQEQMGNEKESRKQFALARAGLDHVGEREKHLILAADYSSQLQNERAAQEYEHLLDIFPDDVEALKGFSFDSFWAGHADKAITAQRKALALSPEDMQCYDTLMTLLVRTSQFSEALTVYQQARVHKLDSENLVFAAALAAWGNGDLIAARQKLDSLDNGSSNYWRLVNRLSVGKLLAFQGRIAEAVQVFRTGLLQVRRPGSEGWMPVFQYQIAKAALVSGNVREAKRECEKYGKVAEKVAVPANLQRGARLFLQIGDLQSAKHFEILARREVVSHPDSFSQMLLDTLEGDIALASSHVEEAIRVQEDALSIRKWHTAYIALAQVCEQKRDWKCAIEAYRQYLTFKGEILRDDAPEDWPLAHYSLAKSYYQSGDLASARTYNQKFLDLFLAADSHLPALVRARKEAALWANRN